MPRATCPTTAAAITSASCSVTGSPRSAPSTASRTSRSAGCTAPSGSRARRPTLAAVLTGYTSTGGLSEAEQMRAAWSVGDVPPLLEVAGRDTAENASRSLPLVLALGDARRVTVVTSAWHIRAPVPLPCLARLRARGRLLVRLEGRLAADDRARAARPAHHARRAPAGAGRDGAATRHLNDQQ